MQVKVAVVGTSWWADSMYYPALCTHPDCLVVAICGRNEQILRERAAVWNIPAVYTDIDVMLATEDLDAVVIASANDTHHAFAKKVLEKGLHLLIEKPIATKVEDAREIMSMFKAQPKRLNVMVPFTYSYMPTSRYMKRLVDQGYIGTPYHLNFRYYAQYGRNNEAYVWRFDKGKAGAGCIADIASHFIYLAMWYFGKIKSVSALLSNNVQRALLDDQGKPYEVADDSCILTLLFENGAQGSIHASTVCHEATSFGQTHHFDMHGSNGTLRSFIDYDTTQEVHGSNGPYPVEKLDIPNDIWLSCRRDTVHNTYRDVFRKENFMARRWVSDIAAGKPSDGSPSLEDGLMVQEVVHACIKSNDTKMWVDVSAQI